jgi:hypothetical protein
MTAISSTSMVQPHNPTLLGLAEVVVDLALGPYAVILVEVATALARFLQTPLGADYEFVGPEISHEHWFGTGIALRRGPNTRREALNPPSRRPAPVFRKAARRSRSAPGVAMMVGQRVFAIALG